MEEEKLSEIESELFSLVNSISNLKNKYNDGFINHHFFRKAINNAMNGLLRINQILKEKKISMSKILDNMDFKREFNNAIEIVKEITNLTPSDEKSLSIFKLPGIASEITTSFITLMDALKLESQNYSLMINLLEELKLNFMKLQLPSLDEIQSGVKEIYGEILKNKSKLMNNNQFRELIVDRLYQLFKKFQLKLDTET